MNQNKKYENSKNENLISEIMNNSPKGKKKRKRNKKKKKKENEEKKEEKEINIKVPKIILQEKVVSEKFKIQKQEIIIIVLKEKGKLVI